MDYVFLGEDINTYIKLESIRSSAYMCEPYISNNFLNRLNNGKILLAGALLNNELVAGCYISSCDNSLYIEQLFVDSYYQDNELHIGSNLLKFILDNKEYVELFFGKSFSFSRLEASDDLAPFYEKIGYRSNDNYLKMVKRI